MSRRPVTDIVRPVLVVLVVVLVAVACGSDDTTETGAAPGPERTAVDDPGDATTTTEGVGGCDTSEWVVVDVGEFSFRTPADLVDQEPQGIDSLVGEYSRTGMKAGFDYGWYSPDFGDLVAAGATSVSMTIDGHDGTLVSVDLRTVPDYEGNHLLGVYVPGVDEADGPASALAMWINYGDEADTPEATCITETITFE